MIVELFSKRQKALRGEVSDIYTYDELPQALRVQIVHIWRDTLGGGSEYADSSAETRQTYKVLVDVLCREYGIFKLPVREDKYDPYSGDRHYLAEFSNFFLQTPETDKALDAV